MANIVAGQQLEYFVYDEQAGGYVPSVKSIIEGKTGPGRILLAKNAYKPVDLLETDVPPLTSFESMNQGHHKLLLSTKQRIGHNMANTGNLRSIQSDKTQPLGRIKQQEVAGIDSKPSAILGRSSQKSFAGPGMAYVMEDRDLMLGPEGKVLGKASRYTGMQPPSQTSLMELTESTPDNKSKLKLLGKSKHYASRVHMKPVECIEEMSMNTGRSIAQSHHQLPPQDTSIHESQLNHMKTVMEKFYGKDLDEAKEYPTLNNGDLFKDILLDAEREKNRKELNVQRRRQMKVMQRHAEELENDLKGNLDFLEKANDDVEKLVKKVEYDSKQRELEILMLDIEEQIQEDNEQIRKLDQLEAENQLSQLLKDNAALLEEVDKDLATGMKPRNYTKPEQKSVIPKVDGSRLHQPANHKLSLLKDIKPKPVVQPSNSKKPQPTKKPVPATKKSKPAAPRKPSTIVQSKASEIDSIRPADSMVGYSATIDRHQNTIVDSIRMQETVEKKNIDKNFFDED